MLMYIFHAIVWVLTFFHLCHLNLPSFPLVLNKFTFMHPSGLISTENVMQKHYIDTHKKHLTQICLHFLCIPEMHPIEILWTMIRKVTKYFSVQLSCAQRNLLIWPNRLAICYTFATKLLTELLCNDLGERTLEMLPLLLKMDSPLGFH